MKILFALNRPRSFAYHESTIKSLRENGVEVIVTCPIKDAERATVETDFKRLGIALTPMRERPRNRKGALIFSLRQLRGFASYLERPEQSPFYQERWRSYLPQGWQSLVGKGWIQALLKDSVTQSILSGIEEWIPAHAEILAHLKEINPDAVVASPANLKASREVEYLKAAKAMEIPCAISVMTWDNLTTKGIFPVIPDMVLAWNHTHAEQAQTIHRVPGDTIHVTGSPFFDKWRIVPDRPQPREKFFAKVGLDSDRPVLFYLGSSPSVAVDETPVLTELRARLDPKVQILARPHPSNAAAFKGLPSEVARVWPSEGQLPFFEEDFQDLRDSFRYSVAAIGLNTSAMVDALIADRPCVCLLLPAHDITQSQALHFRELLDSGALFVEPSVEEGVRCVEELLTGHDRLAGHRKDFVKDLLWPRSEDKTAGWHSARALIALGKDTHETHA